MEDILDLYQQPFDKNYPFVCMDEKQNQLLDHLRDPILMKPGEPGKQDGDYARKGTCSIFLFTEPLASWRHTTVSEHRTKIDWAHQVRELLDVHYPNAIKVLLVMDNLNTHTISSLYEAFPPDEARRLAKRLEMYYTPNMAAGLTSPKLN